MEYRLCDLAPGQWGRVSALRGMGGMRRRLLDLGLVPGAEVRCMGRSPAGDPSAFLICGAVIAIRRADGADVMLGEVWEDG
jgi:ferrous iron transport protein A